MLQQPSGKPEKAEWKSTKPNEVLVTVPLKKVKPGALTLLIKQFGSKEADTVPLQAFAQADHLDSFTLLALLDVTPKLVPSANARNVGCVGAVVGDGKNVSKAVVVKAGHGAEVGGERLALALLKLLDQMLDILSNDLLRGGLLAAAA
jgi:hypothetical protein